MKYHTIVCGTSKSRKEKGYYIKQKKKFWGILSEKITGEEIDPFNYKELGKKYGIYLTDIVEKEKRIISQDKKINPKDAENGMDRFIDLIKKEKPNRILFHGKKAAAWFKQRTIYKRKLTKSVGRITKNLGYGLQKWSYPLKNRQIKIYVLPSTSGNASRWWDETKWKNAWKACKKDV